MKKIFIRNMTRQILNSATVLTIIGILAIYGVFNSPIIFKTCFGKAYKATDLTSIGFMIFLSGVCFLLIPILINKIIYQEKLKNIGLALPNNMSRAVILTIFTMAVLIPAILLLARQPSVIKYYTLDSQNKMYLIILQLVLMPLYYFFEEFFFRGFLLINLWNKVKWHSFWITDILFTLAHLNKPILEFLFAIPIGIIFAFLALNTRSIYPSIITHYFMGIAMILSVNY